MHPEHRIPGPPETRQTRPGPWGRTREQLYQEARRLGVEGRSRMNKTQLRAAVDSKKR